MKIWKKINNFPDYEINNFGEVRSFKLCKNGRILNNLISKGENNTQSKLMEKNIIEIFRLLKSGLKIKEISEIFSVSPSTICDIKMKRTWLHIKGVE